MATLSFKGKSFVQNHHLVVKYHELIPKKTKSLTKKVSLNDNLIIHGDNLKALKALLPTYAGKVRCIYIDPPYNTGNEGWAYNDNVNSPMMQEWLGKVVDREDLTRHDKWLCMMMPRLKLLRELLRTDGVIFISIGEDELSSLRMLLDEIFGERNFVSIIARVEKTASNYGTYFAPTIDFVLCYAKDVSNLSPFSDLVDESLYTKIESKGNRKGEKYRDDVALYQSSLDTRPNQKYFIECPDGSRVIPPTKYLPPNEIAQPGDRVWRWTKDTYLANRELLVFKKSSKSPLLDEKGNQAKWNIYTKSYLSERRREGTKPRNFLDEFINRKAADYLKKLGIDYAYSKPKELIGYFLRVIKTEKDAIILDSFAGSGTTAEAVLALNKEDNGARRFILVECEDYADKITAERIRRVIKGVTSAKDDSLRKGFGGSFSFFELGEPIELENILEGKRLPSYLDLARYVFYTATGDEFLPEQVDEDRHFIGESKEYEVYLFYKPDLTYLKSTALTLDIAKTLGEYTGKKKLVFAPTKYLDLNDSELLAKHGLKGIEYCQLPFEIYNLRE